MDDAPKTPTMLEVQESLTPLCGKVEQQPPEFSALKLKGKRAYDLARAGRSVELAPRIVQINRIDVVAYAWPFLELEIDCSKGTYIRAIARDVGDALGCGGYVQALERSRIGSFTREQAIDARELTAASIGGTIRPLLDAVAHLPRVVIDAAGLEAVAHGQSVPLPESSRRSHPEGKGGLVRAGGSRRPLGGAGPARSPPGNAPAEEGVSLLRRDIPARYNSGAVIAPRTTNGCLLSTWIDGKSRRRFPFSANRAPVVDAIPAAT